MGLPRASGGKRRWSGEVEGSGLPSKAICTSPPHAICAEDTATSHPNHQAHASLSREVELIAPLSIKEVLNQTQVPDMEEHGTSIILTSTQIMEEHSSWHEEDDVEDSNDEIEDEEDEDDDLDNEDDKDSDLSSKDSGFIDSNSIDNSSDEEENRTACLSSESSLPVSGESTEVAVPSPTSLQLSLSQALTDSTLSSTSPDTLVTYTQDCSTVADAITTTTCTSTTSVALCSTTASLHIQGGIVGEGSLTTVTSTQTETVVTSAYQGSLTSPVYDNHSYPYPDNCLTRPGTPAWGNSCNYYEQHNTPKYMEIQPSANNKYMEIQSTSTSKTEISQSIQCDENGKSYLELGSASPYTNTYTNECGSYTTSPTTYPSQTYNQTYTSPSNFTQPGAYYNARQSYSPNPYVYTSGETYTGYEGVQGETGCSYGYGGAGYSANRNQVPSTRPTQRCTTPYCDPTRGISRPSCYNQQRLSVLNMSMYKLNRFRQFAEPSLHRSVLICNTLRHIERELESEGISVASLLSHQNGHMNHSNHTASPPPQGPQQCHEPIPSPPPVSQPSSEGPLPPMQVPMVGSPMVGTPSDPVSMSPSTSTTPPTSSVTYHSGMSPSSPAQYSTTGQYMPVDHPTSTYQQQDTTTHLSPYSPMEQGEHHEQSENVPMSEPSSEVETEVPSPSPSVKSPAIPSEERTDAINWCSVLSLSSQSDLDTMNNNEYSGWGSESSNSNMDYSRGTEVSPSWKLPSLSADDVLKSFPEPNKRLENNEDLDSIINVLVGS